VFDVSGCDCVTERKFTAVEGANKAIIKYQILDMSNDLL